MEERLVVGRKLQFINFINNENYLPLEGLPAMAYKAKHALDINCLSFLALPLYGKRIR